MEQGQHPRGGRFAGELGRSDDDGGVPAHGRESGEQGWGELPRTSPDLPLQQAVVALPGKVRTRPGMADRNSIESVTSSTRKGVSLQPGRPLRPPSLSASRIASASRTRSRRGTSALGGTKRGNRDGREQQETQFADGPSHHLVGELPSAQRRGHASRYAPLRSGSPGRSALARRRRAGPDSLRPRPESNPRAPPHRPPRRCRCRRLLAHADPGPNDAGQVQPGRRPPRQHLPRLRSCDRDGVAVAEGGQEQADG